MQLFLHDRRSLGQWCLIQTAATFCDPLENGGCSSSSSSNDGGVGSKGMQLLFEPPTQSRTSPPPVADLATTNDSISVVPASTIRELASFLVSHTPREFLGAVRASGGRFLYRGDEPESSDNEHPIAAADSLQQAVAELVQARKGLPIHIRTPSPDLLLPETYGCDPNALDYFEALQEQLSTQEQQQKDGNSFVAKPSNGHVATSDPSEASRWGPAVSVWPLVWEQDENETENETAFFSYIWPEQRSTFYSATEIVNEDESACDSEVWKQRQERRRQSLAENENNDNDNDNDSDNYDALVVNKRLGAALLAPGGREVLFATHQPKSNRSLPDSAFCVVPRDLDGELREALEAIHYGLPLPML